MTVKDRVDRIAKAVALTDAGDLPALVALQDAFQELVDAVDEPSLSAIADVAKAAADVVGEIVLRETDDIEGSLRLVHESVDQVLDIMHAAELGAAPADAAADDIDEELLEAWIASCDDGLAEVESAVVELEAADDPGELIAEVRRRIHTLKGESGVLSLTIAQRICHEAESLIDRRADAGAPFPADEVLAVADWLKDYVGRLGGDPRAAAPAHADLLARLVEAEDAAPTASADAKPEPAEKAPAETAPVQAAPTAAAAIEPQADDDDPVRFPDDLGMDEMLTDFTSEAHEHIQAAEAALLDLEQDPTHNELINTVFRAFHTVKGVAGFMNLHPVVDLAHVAETLLDHARNGRIHLDSSYLELILQSCDVLGQLVGALEGSGPAPRKGDHRALLENLKRANAGEAFASGAPSARSAPAATPSTPAAPAAPAPAAAGLAVSAAPTPSTPAAAPAAAPAAGRPAPDDAGKANSAKRKRADQTVKVSTGRMDALVTMVGELVIAQQMVIQDPRIQDVTDQRLQRNLTHVEKIIRDLQEVSMALRMVTVKGTFQKMARLVRDIAAKSGKKIDFRMEGEDTELDRNVVEEIGDPLVHMIRNACDHGLEPVEDRVAAGKPEEGVLLLRAYHQSGSIVIEIKDDGRGLPREKILAKAVERGLISPDRNLDEIPDSEAYNLIFQPGFSTADKITDISGRGVGMDVVRRNIEALRGKVDIRSMPGKGSTFYIRLPLTMAIIDGMVIRVGGQRFVLPTLSIEQSFRPRPEDLSTVVGRGEMAMVRGRLLPIYRLNRVLELDEGIESLENALLIVLESNDQRCCLCVDDIVGQQQVVIKSLGRGVTPARGVAGGAILGDGRVALILDVGGLVAQATSAAT